MAGLSWHVPGTPNGGSVAQKVKGTGSPKSPVALGKRADRFEDSRARQHVYVQQVLRLSGTNSAEDEWTATAEMAELHAWFRASHVAFYGLKPAAAITDAGEWKAARALLERFGFDRAARLVTRAFHDELLRVAGVPSLAIVASYASDLEWSPVRGSRLTGKVRREVEAYIRVRGDYRARIERKELGATLPGTFGSEERRRASPTSSSPGGLVRGVDGCEGTRDPSVSKGARTRAGVPSARTLPRGGVA